MSKIISLAMQNVYIKVFNNCFILYICEIKTYIKIQAYIKTSVICLQ